MRKKFIAGNWKMFTDLTTAKKLTQEIVALMSGNTKVDVAICPPFTYIQTVGEIVKGSNVSLGAQNCFHEKEGAFTGEISPNMLADLGCKYVILGHSERRHKMGECDVTINKKVHAALASGLKVILCLGETLDERQANKTNDILKNQLDGSLAGVTKDNLDSLILAYEPVWAIGTGHNATPQQAQDAHAFIRSWVSKHHGAETASKLIIQYGGSVKPDNAASLLHQADVDGGLIGGASLKADQFLGIIRAGM